MAAATRPMSLFLRKEENRWSELRLRTTVPLSPIYSRSNNISYSCSSRGPTPFHITNAAASPDEGHAKSQKKGADVFVEALEREGVSHVLCFPGDSSMDIHESLHQSSIIHTATEEADSCIDAAKKFARSSNLIGVCITNPSSTEIVSSLASAMRECIPLVVITGQDSFLEEEEEELISTITSSSCITKRNFVAHDVEDVPTIVREAFSVVSSGRPGPVLVHIPKEIQQQAVPERRRPVKIYDDLDSDLELVLSIISESKKPFLYVGGGCLYSGDEVRRFVELTGIPVRTTLMGFAAYDGDTYFHDYLLDNSDLLVAFGIRFDDRITPKIEACFSGNTKARILHIDTDMESTSTSTSTATNVTSVKVSLKGINSLLEMTELDFSGWRKELLEMKKAHDLIPKGKTISQYAINVLNELTDGKAIISNGIRETTATPDHLLTSTAVEGPLTVALRDAASTSPDATLIRLETDETFLSNIGQLATLWDENLPVKIMLFNKQYWNQIGQWENHYNECVVLKRGISIYPRKPSSFYDDFFPDMLNYARTSYVPSARITKKSEIRRAVQTMLETPTPFLLDVILPYPNVLPMRSYRRAFKDLVIHNASLRDENDD